MNTASVDPKSNDESVHLTSSVNTSKFDCELEKFRSLLTTQLTFNKNCSKQLIPVLLASYLLENMVALSVLKNSNVILPLNSVLRNALETTLKLCYLAGTDEAEERHKNIEYSAIQSQKKLNDEWNKTGLIEADKFNKKKLELEQRKKELGLDCKDLSIETLLQLLCAVDDKLKASWYGVYRTLCNDTHGNLYSLSNHYQEADGKLVILKTDRETKLNEQLGQAIEFMNYSGSALQKIFNLSDLMNTKSDA